MENLGILVEDNHWKEQEQDYHNFFFVCKLYGCISLI